MMIGLLEQILNRRYGKSRTSRDGALIKRIWNEGPSDDSCRLYMGMDWNVRLGRRFNSLKYIYGDAFGGFLIGDSVKIAVMMPREVYGLWRMDELQMLDPVGQAQEMDPDIDFFMDAANVCYYGHKKGELYVFDTADDSLDSLGPIEPALHTLTDEWEAAGDFG